jgi:hypothetical protein
MPRESELQTVSDCKQAIAFLEEKHKQMQTPDEKRRTMLKELILGNNESTLQQDTTVDLQNFIQDLKDQVEALLPAMAKLALAARRPPCGSNGSWSVDLIARPSPSLPFARPLIYISSRTPSILSNPSKSSEKHAKNFSIYPKRTRATQMLLGMNSDTSFTSGSLRLNSRKSFG